MAQQGSGRFGRTVPELLSRRANLSPTGIAYRLPESGAEPASEIRWADQDRAVARLAKVLHARGIGPGDRVGIVAATSVAWETAQMAVLRLRGIVVGLDPNYPDAELRGLVASMELSAMFVQDAATAARIIDGTSDSALLIVSIKSSAASSGCGIVALDALLKEAGDDAKVDPPGPAPEDDAIMVFSSGTTGHPKPIVYTHAQVVLAVEALVDAFPDLGENGRLICWLPLANLFQRMINFCAIARGAGSTIVSDPRTVMDHMESASPDLFVGVPRFFERVHAGIRERLASGPRPIAKLGAWSIAAGQRRAAADRAGASLGWLDSLAVAIADRLVLSKVRRVFGRNPRYLLSGSAPMPGWLLEFFDGIGLPVYEAYGVSENIVPVAMNRVGMRKLGTVGRPLPDNEVVVSAESEIRVRGPGVFRGYWRSKPGDPGPDGEGFWSTGDLGAFDEDGCLRIQGRKADIFKTSTGRWVAPLEIEERLRRIPYVEHAVAFGEGRKAVVVLVVLSSTHAALPADQSGVSRAGIDIANAVSDLAAHQQPAGALVVREAFSIGGGELTTNLKLRRKAVGSKYAAAIDRLYEELDAGVSGARDRGTVVRFA